MMALALRSVGLGATQRVALLCTACIVCSLGAYVFGRPLLAWTLPWQAQWIEWLQPGFVIVLSLDPGAGAAAITMKPVTLQPIALTGDYVIPAEARLPASSTNLDHSLLPIVILLTALLGWPTRRWREFAFRAALALPCLLLILACTAPLLLAAKLQMQMLQVIAALGASSPPTALVTTMLFMESGGRWLLPIVCATVCIALAARATLRPITPSNNKELQRRADVCSATEEEDARW